MSLWRKGTSISRRLMSSCKEQEMASRRAQIIDHEDNEHLPRKLWDCFLKLDTTERPETFRSHTLLKRGRSFNYIYGGQIFTHALKAAAQTFDKELNLTPHSMHAYFLKAGSVDQFVDYSVNTDRDGRSFAHRTVVATQDDELLFKALVLFHKDEDTTWAHEDGPESSLSQDPETLRRAEDLLQEAIDQTDVITAKLFYEYKLLEFPPTFCRIFEARPVNQNIYKVDNEEGSITNVDYHFWIKPTIPLGKNDWELQRYLAAYMSDASMVETALLPHLKNHQPFNVTFSLDHSITFHRPKFSFENWMLYEQRSTFAGGNRCMTLGRLFTREGQLVMSSMQSGLARQPK